MRTPSDAYFLQSFEFDSTAPSVTTPMTCFCAGAGTQAIEILRDASSSCRQHGIAVFSLLKCLREASKYPTKKVSQVTNSTEKTILCLQKSWLDKSEEK